MAHFSRYQFALSVVLASPVIALIFCAHMRIFSRACNNIALVATDYYFIKTKKIFCFTTMNRRLSECVVRSLHRSLPRPTETAHTHTRIHARTQKNMKNIEGKFLPVFAICRYITVPIVLSVIVI